MRHLGTQSSTQSSYEQTGRPSKPPLPRSKFYPFGNHLHTGIRVSLVGSSVSEERLEFHECREMRAEPDGGSLGENKHTTRESCAQKSRALVLMLYLQCVPHLWSSQFHRHMGNSQIRLSGPRHAGGRR